MAQTESGLGVVVLNYNDWSSTLKCVRSLLECDPAPSRIVVVDNDSPNDSLTRLRTELSGLRAVDVVGSGFNGGYSFGNNVGIQHLRKLGCRHVVIATSDTEAAAPDLFARLEAAIGAGAGAVGPQIQGPFGLQNPPVERLNLKYVLDLLWIMHGMRGLGLRRRLSRWYRRMAGLPPAGRPADHTGPLHHGERIRKVYKLHGAFICLTEAYLERVGELDERIFMFGEEDLLAWHCFNQGLDQLLVEDALVRHADDSSVNLTWGREAQSFTDTEQRRSAKVLREEIRVGELLMAIVRRSDMRECRT